jgi:hypothetical protein
MNHDAPIDAVAREMTDGDAAPEFRARVLSNLPNARGSQWLRAAIPFSAVAGLAVAWVLVARPAERPLSDAPRPAPAFDAASVPMKPVVPNVQAADAAPPAPRARHSPRVAQMSAEELAWLSRAVPPLPPADPLVLPAIQPDALSIAPITVDPIMSDRLELTPIDSSPGGRD